MKRKDLALAVPREFSERRDSRMFQSVSGRCAEKGEKSALGFSLCSTYGAGWTVRAFVEFVSLFADLESFCGHRSPSGYSSSIARVF